MLKRTQQSFNSTFKPRTTTLASSGRLPAISPKQRAADAEKKRAYAAAPDAGQEWCTACGTAGPVEHSHILSQGNHARHRANPLNWLMLCRACHDLYEHKKAAFRRQYPAVWNETLRRMRLLDINAYTAFCQKHGGSQLLG
jgi:hypothetical protein